MCLNLSWGLILIMGFIKHYSMNDRSSMGLASSILKLNKISR